MGDAPDKDLSKRSKMCSQAIQWPGRFDEAAHKALLSTIERLEVKALDELPSAIWENKTFQQLPSSLQSQVLIQPSSP